MNPYEAAVLREAVDQVNVLRAQLAASREGNRTLREALHPFARTACYAADYERARAALAATGEQQ